ncbi:MAG: hypothetical protein OJF49_002788 [Ktedonobacterales bacterium]|nr:MAG: hypothetical protein OJF49_002788 [Ktedonobacterales bacterium]
MFPSSGSPLDSSGISANLAIRYPAELHYHPNWMSEPGFVPKRKDTIARGFDLLRESTLYTGVSSKAKLRHVVQLIRAYVEPPNSNGRQRISSRRQFIRFALIYSSAQVLRRHYLDALPVLNTAIEAARHMPGEQEILARLYEQRGLVYRADLRLRHAVQDFQDGLHAFDLSGFVKPDFKFQLLVHASGAEIYLDLAESARKHLIEASTLTSFISNPLEASTRVKWYLALLLLYSGHYQEADDYATQAALTFASLESSLFANRAQTTAVEAILSLGEQLPLGSERERRIERALNYQRKAIELANSAKDEPGVYLAQLSAIRGSQLLRPERQRFDAIVNVIYWAEVHKDTAIITQAYTSLGIEYELRGQVDLAKLNLAYAAQSAFDSDLIVLARRPRHRLWLLQELFL